MDDPTTQRRLFAVEGSQPPTDERKWRHNRREFVLAPSLEAAVAKVREMYPDIDLHTVTSRSGTDRIVEA